MSPTPSPPPAAAPASSSMGSQPKAGSGGGVDMSAQAMQQPQNFFSPMGQASQPGQVGQLGALQGGSGTHGGFWPAPGQQPQAPTAAPAPGAAPQAQQAPRGFIPQHLNGPTAAGAADNGVNPYSNPYMGSYQGQPQQQGQDNQFQGFVMPQYAGMMPTHGMSSGTQWQGLGYMQSQRPQFNYGAAPLPQAQDQPALVARDQAAAAAQAASAQAAAAQRGQDGPSAPEGPQMGYGMGANMTMLPDGGDAGAARSSPGAQPDYIPG
jgi:hypothetical protein